MELPPLTALAFCLVISTGSLAQHVSVEQSVSGLLGTQLALRCQLVDPGKTVTVTQVAWVKDPSGAKTNLAVYNTTRGTTYPSKTGKRIVFRKPSLVDATLVIKRLQLKDDGNYSCQFATTPGGNQAGTTKLTVLARPTNTGTALLVRAGDAQVAVASCKSSGGKPMPRIAWRGAVMHNMALGVVSNVEGLFSVTGMFHAVPTGLMDGEEVECIVTHQTFEQPQVIPVTLRFQYPPIVTIEGYDGDWFLNREHASITCNVKANPTAHTYSWKMNGREIPTSIRVVGHQLTVDSVSCNVHGTFTCTANNSLGTSSGSVDIVVRATSATAAGNGLGSYENLPGNKQVGTMFSFMR
ncbi:nectin-2-like [Amblyraja radiata]|uniref:nectin-2-like n=1 Tax=Amblyraja radiata TaxID=386614 RepID=UPI001403F5DF|nr:nectin-2-like [Amblyraja radiata]